MVNQSISYRVLGKLLLLDKSATTIPRTWQSFNWSFGGSLQAYTSLFVTVVISYMTVESWDYDHLISMSRLFIYTIQVLNSCKYGSLMCIMAHEIRKFESFRCITISSRLSNIFVKWFSEEALVGHSWVGVFMGRQGMCRAGLTILVPIPPI